MANFSTKVEKKAAIIMSVVGNRGKAGQGRLGHDILTDGTALLYYKLNPFSSYTAD